MKRIKYSNLVILGIFTYIIFQCILFIIGKNTSTLVLQNEYLEEKISTKGVVIRDETLVTSNTKGKLDLQVDDGEKVKKDQVIANIYQDDDLIEANNKQISELNSDIAKINNMNEGKAKEVASLKLETKKEQRNILQKQNEKNTSKINSNKSGIISYKYDGNENIYNLDILDKLTKEDIINAENNYKAVNNEKNVKDEEIISRIIYGFSTYIATCLNDEEVKKLEINKNINIKIDSSLLSATVDKIYKNDNENIVILKITSQNTEIYDTRAIEFDIIYKQLEGLKIPKKSIKNINDKDGIYVVSQENHNAEFVELKGIQYENDDYVFIDYYQNNIDGIKTIELYDEIILKPNNINKNIKIK